MVIYMKEHKRICDCKNCNCKNEEECKKECHCDHCCNKDKTKKDKN